MLNCSLSICYFAITVASPNTKTQDPPTEKKFWKFFLFPAKQQLQNNLPPPESFFEEGGGGCLTRNNGWEKKIVFYLI